MKMRISTLNFKIFLFSLLFIFSYFIFFTPDIILLSFDTELNVGDENATLEILDILKAYDINATFFVMGSFADKNPEIIKRMLSENHEVACHTQNHERLWGLNKELIEQEIIGCKEAIQNITGETNLGFRAPWRLMNKASFNILEENNFLYDSSYFELQPKQLTKSKEIRTSTIGVFPADDYIMLNFLHLPKSIYFFLLKKAKSITVSFSFHPHIIMQEKDGFENMIEHYNQKKVKFLTHKESIS